MRGKVHARKRKTVRDGTVHSLRRKSWGMVGEDRKAGKTRWEGHRIEGGKREGEGERE